MSNGLCFIRRAGEIVFSIGEIRSREPGRASCAEGQTLAASHPGEVHAKIADLLRLEAILAGRPGTLFAKTPACPVLDMLASPRSS